jgi:MFS family permease
MSAFRKWAIIIAALLPQIFAWGISVSALTLWTLPWLKAFAASHSELMATSMCMLLGIGLMSPVAGHIAEKISVRALIAAGVVLISLSYLLLSRATAMWQIILIHSLPLAAGLVLTSAMMGQILSVKLFAPRPGLAIGVSTLGPSLGGLMSPFIINALISADGWRMALVVLAGAGAAFLPIVLLVVPNLSGSAHAHDTEKTTGFSTMTIFTDRVFIGTVAIVLTLNLLFNAVFYNLGPYLQDIGETASTAKIVSLTAIPAFLGTIIFPWLADRIDYRFLLAVALVLVAVAVAAAAVGANVAGLLVILPVMATCVSGLYSLVPAIMAQRFGHDHFARATGLALPFTFFLGSLGPFIAGYGRDKFGSYPHTFAVMLGFIIIPAIAMAVLATMRNGREKAPGVTAAQSTSDAHGNAPDPVLTVTASLPRD